MAPDFSETTRELVFAGRFSPGALLVVGLMLAGLVGLLAWRDSRSARRRLAPLLSILRIAAVALVLWMLAEPAALTRTTRRRPQRLLMLVDTSASMGVVDAGADVETTLRWAADSLPARQGDLLRAMDAATAAMAAARLHLGSLSSSGQGNARTEALARSVRLLSKSVEAAGGHLDQAAPLLPPVSREMRRALDQVRSDLTELVQPAVAALAAQASGDAAAWLPDRDARLGVLRSTLASGAAQVSRVTEHVLARYARQAPADGGPLLGGHVAETRLESAIGLLAEAESSWLKDLAEGVELRVYGFDGEAFPLQGEDWRDALLSRAARQPMSTDLATALEQVARDAAGEPILGAVLVSDGGHNVERDPLRVASALPAPLYVVPIGDAEPLRDVVLHHVLGPRAVLEGDLIVIEATVDAYRCNGEELTVELMEGDEVLDSATAAVVSDTFARRFTFLERAHEIGSREFLLRASLVEGERLTDNNEAGASVEVIDDKLRVLLADGWPRWEYRFLRNLLKRDERAEAAYLLVEPRRGGDGRPAEGTGLPGDADGWDRYRVAILGDLPPGVLTLEQQGMLEDYVSRRGGTLIVVAGEEAMPRQYREQPLERMLPVDLSAPVREAQEGYRLFVTEEGRFVPALELADDEVGSDRAWREVGGRQPIYHLSAYRRPKPAAHVLIGAWPASASARPADGEGAFLCWHQYGKGRVIYLAAPISYRLRYRHGDRHHHRFWGQLLRWAVARQMAGGATSVRIITDKLRYDLGDDVHVNVRLVNLQGRPVRGASCAVRASLSGRLIGQAELEADRDDPGTYRCTLKGLPAGTIAVQATGTDVQELLRAEGYTDPVAVEVNMTPPDALELRNTRCNLPLLKQIAERSGGALVPPAGLEAAVSLLDTSPEVTETVSQRPLWARWPFLYVFLGCLTAEWVLRKLAGLA